MRWAGDFSDKVNAVFGFYAFDQQLNTDPVHSEAVGADYWRFVWTPPTATAPNGTPNPRLWSGRLDCRQLLQRPRECDHVAARYGERRVVHAVGLHDRRAPAPDTGLAIQLRQERSRLEQQALNIPVIPAGSPSPPSPVYTNAAAVLEDDDTNVSGQLTLAFDASDRINYYATYATAFKSIGVNLGPAASGWRVHRNSAGGSEPHRARAEEHSEAGDYPEPLALQHQCRGLPDANVGSRHQPPGDRERRRGSHPRRRVGFQCEYRRRVLDLHCARLQRRRVHFVRERAASARADGIGGASGRKQPRSSTLRAADCPASRSGRLRSAASIERR